MKAPLKLIQAILQMFRRSPWALALCGLFTFAAPSGHGNPLSYLVKGIMTSSEQDPVSEHDETSEAEKLVNVSSLSRHSQRKRMSAQSHRTWRTTYHRSRAGCSINIVDQFKQLPAAICHANGIGASLRC
jgi:hypothetical protein